MKEKKVVLLHKLNINYLLLLVFSDGEKVSILGFLLVILRLITRDDLVLNSFQNYYYFCCLMFFLLWFYKYYNIIC